MSGEKRKGRTFPARNWAVKVNRWIYKENLTMHEAQNIRAALFGTVHGLKIARIYHEAEEEYAAE